MLEESSPKKPVHELKEGRLRVAIWSKDTDNGVVHTANLSRLYKDKEDKWQDAQSLYLKDLPVAAGLLATAHDWMSQHETEQAIDAEDL